MQLAKELKSEIKEAKKYRLPRWAILPGIIGCLLIVWLFDHFGRLNLYLPTMNSVGVLGFVLVLKRKLRRCVWFWIAMTIIAALHVPLVLFVPWTTRWVPALAIAAIDSADLIVMLAILAVVGNFVERSKTAER